MKKQLPPLKIKVPLSLTVALLLALLAASLLLTVLSGELRQFQWLLLATVTGAYLSAFQITYGGTVSLDDRSRTSEDARHSLSPDDQHGTTSQPPSKIQKGVERTAGGSASHVESVSVVETFRGETIWEGIVEVLKLDSPPPELAYGWAVEGDDEPEYVAVLGKPPINAPIDAVRAWIVSQSGK